MARTHFQHITFVRLEGFQRVGPGARRIVLQPRIAHIAVNLIGHDGVFINDRGHTCRQAVVKERRRIGLVDFDDDVFAVCRDHGVNVFRRPAELVQDKRRGFVDLDRALQRKRCIFGAQRVAR